MPIINSGILGGFKNKISSCVGYRKNGNNIMRIQNDVIPNDTYSNLEFRNSIAENWMTAINGTGITNLNRYFNNPNSISPFVSRSQKEIHPFYKGKNAGFYFGGNQLAIKESLYDVDKLQYRRTSQGMRIFWFDNEIWTGYPANMNYLICHVNLTHKLRNLTISTVNKSVGTLLANAPAAWAGDLIVTQIGFPSSLVQNPTRFVATKNLWQVF